MLYASVAQLVEQGTENPRVVGSIPTGGTICGFSSFGRAPPCQGGGGGFEPRNPLHSRARDSCPFLFQRSMEQILPCPLKEHTDRGSFFPVPNRIRRHSQAVRHGSAKPLSPGSNPGGASRKKHICNADVLFSTKSAVGGRNPPAVDEIASR